MSDIESFTVTIDGGIIAARKDQTILQVLKEAGKYVPTLCNHPDLPGFGACGLCVVEVAGMKEPVKSCIFKVSNNMNIITNSENLKKVRQENLSKILATHPHACLVCSQNEGCDRRTCSSNVSVEERCCDIFNDCELRRLAEYIGIKDNTPRYRPKDYKKKMEKGITRDYNLCIGCGRCVNVCSNYRGLGVFGELPVPAKLFDPSDFPDNLNEAGCQFCGLCVHVCPTGALMDDFIYSGHKAPCQHHCPAHIDIPLFLRHAANKDFKKALMVIYESIPFPGTLGRVCYFPCEGECRRKSLDDPVSIMNMKKFLFNKVPDSDFELGERKPSTGKQIAVIGSGPAGLTSAFYLSCWGHDVKVFESKEQSGGMLRYGIPAFRLPKDVLDREIKIIQGMGVDIQTGCAIRSMNDPHLKNYDSVILAIGAQKGKPMGIPGENSVFVKDALEFLRNILTNPDEGFIKEGMKVGVIGGGNTAMDAARTALRLGADVTVIYRRSEKEMPAYLDEVTEAKDEGVKFKFLASPIEITQFENEIDVKFDEMTLESAGLDGRQKPIASGNHFIMRFDRLISAIGQQIMLPDGIKLNDKGKLDYNVDNLQLNKGLFLCGDVAYLSNVVESVHMGRKVAENVHRYLGGTDEFSVSKTKPEPHISEREMFLSRRGDAKCMPIEPARAFDEQKLTFKDEAGSCEASRCLQCDLRYYLSDVLHPPTDMLVFNEINIKDLPDEPGVFILLGENNAVLEIKGTPDLRKSLYEKLRDERIKFFRFVKDQMYSKRESELLQQHLQKHGQMPKGGDDLDDLF